MSDCVDGPSRFRSRFPLLRHSGSELLQTEWHPMSYSSGWVRTVTDISVTKETCQHCLILSNCRRQTKPNPRPSWCFEPARPFKKSTIAQQLMEPTIQQEYEMEEDGTSRMDDTAVIGPTGRLLRHFVSKVGEVKSLVKNAALTSLIDRHIKG